MLISPIHCIQNEIKTAVYCKRKLLVRAFDILKVEINGRETVTPNRWTQLMGVIMPTKSAAQIDLLMQVLDINGDTFICKNMRTWLYVVHVHCSSSGTYIPRMLSVVHVH